MPKFNSKSLESYKPIKYLQSHIKKDIKNIFTFAGILPAKDDKRLRQSEIAVSDRERDPIRMNNTYFGLLI